MKKCSYIFKEKKERGLFARKPTEKKDEENLILVQSDYAFVIMNKFLYNNGHVMVVPKHHHMDIDQLRERISRTFLPIENLHPGIKKMPSSPWIQYRDEYGKWEGLENNISVFHIVPRWIGNTNFMPVLSETKIIPEYLEETLSKTSLCLLRALSGEKRGAKGGRKK